MKRYLIASYVLAPVLSMAQGPTWADDVACIIYSHCHSCHRPGAIGGEHLDLSTYGHAFAHRDDIAAYVTYRVMPPWPPDENSRRFAHERTLTQDEIDIIAAWAEADGPQGDMANAPTLPSYSGLAEIDDPDLTARMEDYMIPPTSTDLYRCFVLPTNNPTDNFIKRLEVIPGNREVVHHVLVYQDTSGQAQLLDDADPDIGYTSFGGIGVENAPLVGIWVPGSPVMSSPPGMGLKFYAGADLVIQVHYPAGSGSQVDSTRVNLQYGFEPFTRELGIIPALDHVYTIQNGPLIIPPDEVRTFRSEFTVPLQSTITAIGPHAHLICTSMRAWAITPDNDSIPLIDIPEWDFHWQGMYEFRNPIFLPTGTVLHGEATYDNTANNNHNPNDPPAWVFLGEATTDEMMLFYFAYTFGLPSDTLIVVDDSEHGDHHQDCTTEFAIGLEDGPGAMDVRIRPVPATDRLQVLVPPDAFVLRLLDTQGRPVALWPLREGDNSIDVHAFARAPFVAEVRDRRGVVIHRSKLLLQ